MSAIAALVLVFVLPALAGGVLLAGTSRGGLPETPIDVLIARGVACGLTTWLLGSGLVTSTVGLTATSAWVWCAVVGAVSLVVLLMPRHRLLLRAGASSVGRRLAVTIGLTALVYVPIGYVVVRTSWSPLGSTPWYYYGLARQVAESGSIPSTSTEFGVSAPFLNDYHLFTTGTAMLLKQQPDRPITVIIVVTILAVALLGIGMVAYLTALGASRTVSLLAIPVAVATGIAPARLSGYRPEGFALGLTLLFVALAMDWMRRRDWRSLLAGALIAALLSQVHGIAAVTAAVLVAAAVLVTLTRATLADQLKRAGIAIATFGGAVLVTGLVFREASGTVHSGGLVDQGGLADPTWEFYQAARHHQPSVPPTNASMIHDTIQSMYEQARWWIVPALVLASVGLWAQRRDPVVRRLLGFTFLALFGLGAIASVFMLGWEGYVPRRTGASRIVLEASLLVPPFVAIGLAALVAQLPMWVRRLRWPTAHVRIVVAIGLVTACALVTSVAVARFVNHEAPSRDELAAWESLPLTSGDIVLSNGYTEGFIPDVTDANGLLDGRAPYTFDDLLTRANGLLRGAQSFFDDPSGQWQYLADNDVTWIVLGKPKTYALSTGNVWSTPVSPDVLAQCRGLELVLDSPTVTAFRVVDSGPGGCTP